jgi:hypothetical protein
MTRLSFAGFQSRRRGRRTSPVPTWNAAAARVDSDGGEVPAFTLRGTVQPRRRDLLPALGACVGVAALLGAAGIVSTSEIVRTTIMGIAVGLLCPFVLARVADGDPS